MGKIQELSEMLANQIAAGEVVERPASVVKELVENAIDAGSNQIDIYIEEAGLRKIQVIDNGEGMVPEDVENAFKRHATSKIHSRDDLFRIRTLGFRGEALPSIASVSEISIETSTGEEIGTQVQLKAGKVMENKPFSLRQGTKITVENLFFNTPARLKYVKTIQTELANIGDIVNRLAMSHPHTAFRLVHDGNKMLSTIGNGDLKQTIAGIYGISTAKKMLEISKKDLDFQISGYISLPEVTRASRNYISIIINGRYIKNYLLNKAIVEGYGSKLMVGRYPLAVIEITMDPLLIDVNVHPTKQEVRLSKEKELIELIRLAIQEKLAEQQLIPNAANNLQFKRKTEEKITSEQGKLRLNDNETIVYDKKQSSSHHQVQRPKNFKEQGLGYDAQTGKFYATEGNKEKQVGIDSERVAFPEENLTSQEAATPESIVNNKTIQSDSGDWLDDPFESSVISNEFITEENAIYSNMDESAESTGEAHQEVQRFPELEYFGQMHGTYLFAQSAEGLYILDQHAAQERIKYEFFRKKIGEVTNDLQDLLVPFVLDYPNNDAIRIKENTTLLENVGIYLEEFGQNSFIVRSHPNWYPQGEEEEIIKGMIDMLLTSGKVDIAKFREATAIMMSCKQSIKANHYLNEEQARILLDDLAKCENPFNCPHGRPVLVHFTNKDMEKMFKRIQDSHESKRK